MNTIIFNTYTQALKAVMSEAIVTANPDFVVAYTDTNPSSFIEAAADGVFNGQSSVILVAATPENTVRLVRAISIHNKDSISHTFTLSIVNGTQILWKGLLAPLETFTLEGTYDPAGRRKLA